MSRAVPFRTAALWLSAATALFRAALCQATSLEPRDLRQIAAASAQVIHGTVLGSRSHWNDEHTLVVTETRVRTIDVLKGANDSVVLLTMPGGRIGKLVVDVPGIPPFRAGEETILFVVDDPKGTKFVEGGSRGRFDVVIDGHTGERVVSGSLAAQLQAALRPGAAAKSAPGKTAALGGVLADLRALVRDVAAKGGR